MGHGGVLPRLGEDDARKSDQGVYSFYYGATKILSQFRETPTKVSLFEFVYVTRK